MKRLSALSLVAIGGLLAWNYGSVIDALRYPRLLAQVREILPDGWQTLSGPAEAQLSSLEAMMDAESLEALERANGALRLLSGGVVLALADGFEVEEFLLSSGCFRFARRTVDLFVIQIEADIGCLR